MSRPWPFSSLAGVLRLRLVAWPFSNLEWVFFWVLLEFFKRPKVMPGFLVRVEADDIARSSIGTSSGRSPTRSGQFGRR